MQQQLEMGLEIEDGMARNPKLKARGKGKRHALSSVEQADRILRSDSFDFMGRRPVQVCRIYLVLVTACLLIRRNWSSRLEHENQDLGCSIS
jgi:hypothetical protein